MRDRGVTSGLGKLGPLGDGGVAVVSLGDDLILKEGSWQQLRAATLKADNPTSKNMHTSVAASKTYLLQKDLGTSELP